MPWGILLRLAADDLKWRDRLACFDAICDSVSLCGSPPQVHVSTTLLLRQHEHIPGRAESGEVWEESRDVESRSSPRTKRGNRVSSRGWLSPNSRNSGGLGPGGHGTVRRERCPSTHSPADKRTQRRFELSSCKGRVAVRQQCKRLEGVESEAYPHQKATKPGPPKRCPSGGSRHLSESGTDTSRPAKAWVRYRRCRDAVPAGPSRLERGPGTPRVWFKVPLPRGLSANGSRSGPASDADSTTLSIWPIWNPDRDPGQTDAAHSSTDRDLPRSVQSCQPLLDDMPPFPLAALNSTTWIQDHKSHLPCHNKYTSPQNQSTCPLGLPH